MENFEFQNFKEILEKGNTVLKYKTTEKQFRRFLANKGHEYSALVNFAQTLGLESKIIIEKRNKTEFFNSQWMKISDFFQPEKSKLFVELINLSSLGIYRI